MDAYVDLTGRVTGYAVADLRELGDYDWRLSARNVWKVEKWLVDYPHRPLPHARGALPAGARALQARSGPASRIPRVRPAYFEGRETWL